MKQDIKKAIQKTKGEKIITKHEWMIATLEVLEKDTRPKKLSDPDSASILYEALFIDPSKLTPY